MKILLDTNAYSNLLKGDRFVQKAITGSQLAYVSVITIGELLTGFKVGSKEKANISTLTQFLSKPGISILEVSQKTSAIYREIKYYLRKRGTPIPSNDVWIASQTVETNSSLITYDCHFLKIKGLKVWDKLKNIT